MQAEIISLPIWNISQLEFICDKVTSKYYEHKLIMNCKILHMIKVFIRNVYCCNTNTFDV